MGLVRLGGVDDWEIPALRDLYGEQWEIDRAASGEITATHRDSTLPEIRSMSAGLIRAQIAAADWDRVSAKYRPSY